MTLENNIRMKVGLLLTYSTHAEAEFTKLQGCV